MKKIRLSFECDLRVFGGDSNLVCDVEKDKKGGVATAKSKSKEEVFSLKKQLQFADIWRIHNPDIMRFTWMLLIPGTGTGNGSLGTSVQR